MADILTTPKNTSRKPYIYKVTNLETGQYYVGSQCSGKTIGVNYFTSSTNKVFRADFKNCGEEKYEITIIKEFSDPEECVREENYLIWNHLQLKDSLCLNKACCCNNKKIFSRLGIHPPEETRKKLSMALKGHTSPKKGIPLPEEVRQKMSEAHKGIYHTEEARKKMSIAQQGHPGWNKGIHHSEETRKRISEVKKGIPRSEDVRKKLSEANKNRIKISINGTVFSSITAASKYYNVHKTTIRNWIKTGNHNTLYIEK